jgi:hypothetical protein
MQESSRAARKFKSSKKQMKDLRKSSTRKKTDKNLKKR